MEALKEVAQSQRETEAVRLVRRFFKTADDFDTDRFLATLSPDVQWRFGNYPAGSGREAVRSAYEFIKSNVVSMRHDVISVWTDGECWVAETVVHYHDNYGRAFSFPACDLLFVRDSLFREVRIFVDNHELFVPPAEKAPALSQGRC